MKGLFSSHLQLSAKVMDMRLKRQNVVMSNLANLENPKYRARRLEFEKDLQAALSLDMRGKMTKTTGEHLPAVFDPNKFGPEWEKAMKERVVLGEDQVDVDREMTVLGKNTMMYNALSLLVKRGFQGMTKIIQEGSK